MNLANLGLSGLLAAQHRMQTVGHNINNADTDGFNRQTVLVQTAGANSYGAGYIGRGVQAVTVQRAYDGFLYRQLVNSQSQGASLVAYGNEISRLNNFFSDRTVGVSPALEKFFDGLQAVASSPADPAARQELLGRSASLVTQLNDANRFLDDQRENINTQITTVVKQINSYVERVNDLNRQITMARATTANHEPNDLLDQRDQLFAELNQLVGVKAVEQDGKFNITLGNGQVLLGGNAVFPLHAVPSADDPSRFTIAYISQSEPIEMDERSLSGGTLGGLLAYRRDTLDAAQNELGRLAVGLALSINEAHMDGVDLAGDAGSAFFSIGNITALPAAGNDSASGPLRVSFEDAAQLTAQDYQLRFDGNDYLVTRLPDGSPIVLDPAAPRLDGLLFELPSPPAQAGDSWLVQPTRAAAGSLQLAVTDPAKIAAAKAGMGSADGGNALDMAALQTKKVLGGNAMSLTAAFSQIVNRVGVQTQQNATAAKAQASLIDQNFAAQQRLSGVNLDEEYINLYRYQDQFRAASRLIDVSSTLFDTLLSLRN